MQSKSLAVYINDHLAGSVAALEMLDHLIDSCAGQPLAAFFVDLKREIKSDQEILQELLGRAGKKESLFRKTAGWVTEKLARAKFKFGGSHLGGLGLLQALEVLALGIRGKELLWRALAAADEPPLRDVDLARLQQRAIEQQAAVEDKRLEAARAALR